MKRSGGTHKLEEIVIFARQQGFFLALHVLDSVLEEAVLFGDNFVEERDRLPALCRAFHARRHKCVIQVLRCCLSAGSILLALVFLFVSSTVINQTTTKTLPSKSKGACTDRKYIENALRAAHRRDS